MSQVNGNTVFKNQIQEIVDHERTLPTLQIVDLQEMNRLKAHFEDRLQHSGHAASVWLWVNPLGHAPKKMTLYAWLKREYKAVQQIQNYSARLNAMQELEAKMVFVQAPTFIPELHCYTTHLAAISPAMLAEKRALIQRTKHM